MGNSADCLFTACGYGSSHYFYHICDHCNKVTGRQIVLEFTKGEPSLSSFIHEVNECEVVDILHRIMKFDKHGNPSLKFDAKLRKKYKGFMDFKRHGPIKNPLVSHIISPYGCCGCITPSSKCRVRW
jgi:hypothetical protein